MKRIPVLYPIVFALIPTLSLLAANLGEIPTAQAVRPLLICAAFSGALLFGLWRGLKDAHRAGFITFLVVMALLYYQIAVAVAGFLPAHWSVFRQSWSILIGWSVFLSGLGSRWVWRKIKHPQMVTLALTLAGVVIVSMSVGTIGFYYVEGLWHRTPRQSAVHLQGEHKPDIYYIIVDGYAGDEVLRDLYAYDNAEFLEFLQHHGFYVAAHARSNYIQTTLSLASSLNLNYLTGLPPKSVNRGHVWNLIQYNAVRSALESYGYQTVALSSGYYYTEFKNAYRYLAPPDIPEANTFEAALLFTSATRVLIDGTDWLTGFLPTWRMAQDHILYNFEQLAQVSSMPGPKFVFAHIILPHPPFMFDQDGQRLNPDQIYFLFDGEDFHGTDEEYLAGYVGQLSYINTLLMQTLEAILENSETPPVILLQADHGPGALLNFQSLTETCVWERTSILSAYYLPATDASVVYDSVTPVNSFRIVFDTYFGTELGLLEDRTYYSTWSHPYDFVDVTEATRQPCQLP